jgi:hypothetical protein
MQFAPGSLVSAGLVGVVDRQLLPQDVSTRMIVGRGVSALILRSAATIATEFLGSKMPDSAVQRR